jgi:hypothetical protein
MIRIEICGSRFHKNIALLPKKLLSGITERFLVFSSEAHAYDF